MKTTRAWLHGWAMVLGVTALSACNTLAGKINYAHSEADLKFSGSGALVVAVQDRRLYVVAGKEPEKYVGFARGGYGNPVPVYTASRAPLASEMADSLLATLRHSGFKVQKLDLPASTGAGGAQQNLGGAGRAILLVLDEWKTTTGTSWLPGTGGYTTLFYNATLSVMKRGKVVASKTVQGKDDIGSDWINPSGHAQEAMPDALRQKLETLLNDVKVVQALK